MLRLLKASDQAGGKTRPRESEISQSVPAGRRKFDWRLWVAGLPINRSAVRGTLEQVVPNVPGYKKLQESMQTGSREMRTSRGHSARNVDQGPGGTESGGNETIFEVERDKEERVIKIASASMIIGNLVLGRVEVWGSQL